MFSSEKRLRTLTVSENVRVLRRTEASWASLPNSEVRKQAQALRGLSEVTSSSVAEPGMKPRLSRYVLSHYLSGRSQSVSSTAH